MTRTVTEWEPCLSCNGEEGQFLNGDWYDCDNCEGEGGRAVVVDVEAAENFTCQRPCLLDHSSEEHCDWCKKHMVQCHCDGGVGE